MKRSIVRTGRLAALAAAAWIVAGLPLAGHAAEDCGGIADRIRHGGVLWTEGAIVVQGTAAPNLANPDTPLSVIKRMTQDAARLDAYRKAAGVLTGVRVSSAAIAADSPRVVTRIEAFVRNARVCKAKYYADGGVDMVVMVPLGGAFAMEQMPEAGTRVAAGASDYSGLLVDARHLGFAPAIAPRLIDPDGNVLYDASRVQAAVVRGRGGAQYLAPGDPRPAELLGERPLQVRAERLGAASPSDLVLPAEAVGALGGGPAFLGEGRVAVIVAPPAADDCREAFDRVTDRHVDWANKLVLARGYGRVDFSRDEDVSVRMRKMERAAEVDAQRKLLETFLAVRIDGRRQVEDLPGVAERARGIIANAIPCGAKYFKDGSAEVVMAAPLDAMAAMGLAAGQTTVPAVAAPAAHSGVIVDAAGLGFEPVLTPRIKSFTGAVLYGPDRVARSWVQHHGVAGYHGSVAAARADDRVGERPLVVRAARAEGGGDLLLSGEGARALEGLAGAPALTQGRVVVVTENAGATTETAAATGGTPPSPPPARLAPAGPGPRVREGKLDIP